MYRQLKEVLLAYRALLIPPLQALATTSQTAPVFQGIPQALALTMLTLPGLVVVLATQHAARHNHHMKMHGPPFGPIEPALQVQSAASVLPAGALELPVQASQCARAVLPRTVEYVPAGQFSQALGPGVGLYVPAKHSAHVPPSGPEDPALHVQSLSSLLPTAECDRSGQAVHESKVVPPSLTEYVPAGHCKQAAGLGPEPIL